MLRIRFRLELGREKDHTLSYMAAAMPSILSWLASKSPFASRPKQDDPPQPREEEPPIN